MRLKWQNATSHKRGNYQFATLNFVRANYTWNDLDQCYHYRVFIRGTADTKHILYTTARNDFSEADIRMRLEYILTCIDSVLGFEVLDHEYLANPDEIPMQARSTLVAGIHTNRVYAHKSGRIYRMIVVSNLHVTDSDKWPPTIAYRDIVTGVCYSRPIAEFTPEKYQLIEYGTVVSYQGYIEHHTAHSDSLPSTATISDTLPYSWYRKNQLVIPPNGLAEYLELAVPTINLKHILAVNNNGVIGDNNRLPWKCKADLLEFKRVTKGFVVIMGRKTFESLPGPLTGRKMIVVTRDASSFANRPIGSPPAYNGEAIFVSDIFKAIEATVAYGIRGAPTYIVGGAELYRQTSAVVNEAIISIINNDNDGDTKMDWRYMMQTAITINHYGEDKTK